MSQHTEGYWPENTQVIFCLSSARKPKQTHYMLFKYNLAIKIKTNTTFLGVIFKNIAEHGITI